MNPDEMLKDWEKAFVLFRENWKADQPVETPHKAEMIMSASVGFYIFILIVLLAFLGLDHIFDFQLRIRGFRTCLIAVLSLGLVSWLVGFISLIFKEIKEVRMAELLHTERALKWWHAERKTIQALKDLSIDSRKNLKSHMARTLKKRHQPFASVAASIGILLPLLLATPALLDTYLHLSIPNLGGYFSFFVIVAIASLGFVFGSTWLYFRGVLPRYDHWIFLLDQSLEDTKTPKKEERPPTLLEKISRLIRP